MVSNLAVAYNLMKDKQPFEWLNGRSFSDAFVICIGAGPWRFKRRQTIQRIALEKLSGRNIEQLKLPINWYPLNWQNSYINNLIEYLHGTKQTMDEYCSTLRTAAKTAPIEALQQFYLNVCHNKNGTKVLSLFCRDALKIDSFPIDRHVRRRLIELSLPVNEFMMIDLCKQCNLDSRLVATAFVKDAGNMDNPNWNIKSN